MNTGRASSLAYGIGRCSARSVDDGHVPFVVALASGGREVVQPFNLLVAQLDAVGGGVLLDAGDAARPVTTKSQSFRFGFIAESTTLHRPLRENSQRNTQRLADTVNRMILMCRRIES